MLVGVGLLGVTEPSLIPCVVYAAKSTEDKRGSIPEQLHECRAAIGRVPGRSLVDEYVDESCSAFSEDRGPGLLEAMRHVEDLAEEHGAAELWAQHSDRLARGDGRSARHAVEIALWAMKRGVVVRTLQDPDTFRDLLYAVVVGQRNHEDSRRKSFSVAAGRRRAAERGEHLGYRPDGYMFVADVDPKGAITKRMVIDPAREPVIGEIFRLALRGKQPGPITAAINKQGFVTAWVRGKSPVPWTVAQVCEVLRNPRYAGLSPYKGAIVARGQWPGYITEREHLRIIGRIGAFKPTKYRRKLEPYLLARVGRCGHCGSTLYAMTGHEHLDGTFLRRYVCASHSRTYEPGRCAAPPMSAETIEAMFVASIRTLLLEGDDEASTPARDTAGWTRSFEREKVIDAVLGGNDVEINGALQQLLARMSPSDARIRQLALSQRSGRQLEAVDRFEQWAAHELEERSEATRTETVKLNRLLRSWFQSVSVAVDETGVEIRATRPATRDGRQATETGARVDLREWARSAPRERRVHPPNRKWPQAEILGALQAWADKHGRSPRFSDWRQSGPFHPSSLTVRKKFGTWPDALRQAGLTPTFPIKVPRNYAWDERAMVRALQDWVDDHGRPPTFRAWRQATPDRPCGETIRVHFGSFRAGLMAAGLVLADAPQTGGT
jgi:DNA invertase Pin-like site-specific DNA recombinase